MSQFSRGRGLWVSECSGLCLLSLSCSSCSSTRVMHHVGCAIDGSPSKINWVPGTHIIIYLFVHVFAHVFVCVLADLIYLSGLATTAVSPPTMAIQRSRNMHRRQHPQFMNAVLIRIQCQQLLWCIWFPLGHMEVTRGKGPMQMGQQISLLRFCLLPRTKTWNTLSVSCWTTSGTSVVDLCV